MYHSVVKMLRERKKMIEEIMLFAMVGQMALTCAIVWKLIQLDKKQQSTIFGVSHVWGSVNSLIMDKQNKNAPKWNRSGATGETDPAKMESPDAWLKRVQEEE